MNTLKVEAKLAEKYYYKPLPGDLSRKYRNWYIENMPEFLKLEGSKDKIYTKEGTLISNGYDRIVVGDYGAFIEFSIPGSEFIITPGQEYRVNNPRYSERVKYIWMTVKDKSNIKIYKQKRTVTYADYKAGKYYVSVHEVVI